MVGCLPRCDYCLLLLFALGIQELPFLFIVYLLFVTGCLRICLGLLLCCFGVGGVLRWLYTWVCLELIVVVCFGWAVLFGALYLFWGCWLEACSVVMIMGNFNGTFKMGVCFISDLMGLFVCNCLVV